MRHRRPISGRYKDSLDLASTIGSMMLKTLSIELKAPLCHHRLVVPNFELVVLLIVLRVSEVLVGPLRSCSCCHLLMIGAVAVAMERR